MPLYVMPEYPGVEPRAEYHPEAVVQPGDALGPTRTLALGKAIVLPAGATIADEAGNRAVLAIRPPALKGVLVSGTVSPTRSSVRAAAFASFR